MNEFIKKIKLDVSASNIFGTYSQYYKKDKYPLYVIGAILLIASLGYLVNHLGMWPLYSIVFIWAIIIRKFGNKKNISKLTLVTVLFILYSWVGASIIAGIHAPDGQKFDTFNNWFNMPLVTTWAILSGSDLTSFAVTVREVWQVNLIWYLPCFIFLVWYAVEKAYQIDKNASLHGTAYFEDPVNANVNLVGHKEGLLLGIDKKTNREVILPTAEVHEHTLIDGAPGAGKSASIFAPNLLRIAEKGGYANLVVTDPKMELLSICGPELLKAGYDIMIFHPYEPMISDAWNMLHYAKDWELCDDMVMSIITNTNLGSKSDIFFDSQTNMALDLICFYLRDLLGERATMNHVQALAAISNSKDIMAELKNSKNDKLRLNASGFFSKIEGNERLLSSIMSDLPRRLKLWTIDPVRATTSKNEVIFEKLCSDSKVALFVITPIDKKDQLRPLFATFFGQLFKVVQEKGRELGKLPRPLWFKFDEFANLGNIPGFDNFLTVVRGYRVGVTMGIQSISQLDDLYGKDKAKTIVNSCANYIIMPRIGVDDAKYFSGMLGTTTRLTNMKKKKKDPFKIILTHEESESAVKRDLMTPDEIRSLDLKENLIVIAGTRRPVLLRPALYYREPKWMNLGKECVDEILLKGRRSVFDRGLLGKDPLLVPNEQDIMDETAIVNSAEYLKEILAKQKGAKNTSGQSSNESGIVDPNTKADENKHPKTPIVQLENTEEPVSENNHNEVRAQPASNIGVRLEKQQPTKLLTIDDGKLFGRK